MSRRWGPLARVVGIALMVCVALPSAALAAPAPDACAGNRAITYTAPVPDGLRTVGTKRVQWRAEYTDAATGELVVDDAPINNLVVDAAAAIYENPVLIRLFRSTTILADGTVITVPAINPSQVARMYVNVSWVTGEPFFTGTFVESFRYEVARNRWSDWLPTTASAVQSFCTEQTKAIWKKGYGWE